MTILDANVLLYAYDETSAQHPKVSIWLTEQIARREVIGLPWISLWAFLRVATNLRIQRTPLSLSEAFEVIEEIQRIPNAVIVQPGPLHAGILRSVATTGQATGPRMTDAILAALAVEHGAKLASTDQDFARYAELNWVNPLN
jgi:toxin-antitoxin system PIN domain toxin